MPRAHAHTSKLDQNPSGGVLALPWSLAVTSRVSATDAVVDSAGEAALDSNRLSLQVALKDRVLHEGEVTELEIHAQNMEEDEGAAMTVAVVGIPAGLTPKPSQLQALVHSGAVDAWETRGREMVLYWRQFAPGQLRKLRIVLSAQAAGIFDGPTSRMYLYYDEAIRTYAAPVWAMIKPLAQS